VSAIAPNKRKIFNDPVHGFITIPDELVFDIIEHPYFQRLRRIRQLGLTPLVYPGALHTRFHHALGAMHLMGLVIDTLRQKGNEITPHEEDSAILAILLHDIGHGPYSHALEYSIVHCLTHEDLSILFMKRLNEQFGGKLTDAISIFKDTYPKKFLHQLVSSQLDTDRLDYLKRDSYFTGVSEGVINTDRIIAMLNVQNDELVMEGKGIYTIEKFIMARRFMYWQVYYHKTVVAAEQMLIHILKRAKELAEAGIELFGSPPLQFFLKNSLTRSDFEERYEVLETFARLDDFDIYAAIKVWAYHSDPVLSYLSSGLINRKLFRVELQAEPFDMNYIDKVKKQVRANLLNILPADSDMVFEGTITNNAYNPESDRIKILYRDGVSVDITEASEQINVSVLSKSAMKHFLCYPKLSS
jgi:HD superfamily phosphohydrolase